MFYITDIEQYVKSVSNCWKKAYVRDISSIQIVKKKYEHIKKQFCAKLCTRTKSTLNM